MIRNLIIYIFLLLPFTCLGQVNISGKIVNQADQSPVANASVFLSNATIGAKTANDGTFILNKVKSGKYELIVSIVGFETYRRQIIVNNISIALPNLSIAPKTISLMEVKIKPQNDANRQKYLQQFRDAFIGTSQLARQCKIINPEMLDLEYNDETNTLTASSVDFLVIENQALGYRLKYLLGNFYKQSNYFNTLKTHYEGSVFFEEMQGTPSQQKKWEKQRQRVYQNSPIHFLRSVIANRINEEGFRIFQYAYEPNPLRPADDIIATKIDHFTKLQASNKHYADSLSYWVKKSKLDKTFQTLRNFPLDQTDILKPTDQPKMYALSCELDGLHVTYNEDGHFSKNGALNHINDPINTETTLISFNTPNALVDNNGGLADPNSLSFSGAWGHYRVAELLPVDYEAPQSLPTAPAPAFAENAIAKLKTFTDQHINEKTYLHFDKPYYAAGDTVYFKAYVTQDDDHQLTSLSGVLHVDLINTTNKIDRSIKLQLADGVAWGDFALADSLPKGNYRIRAYTNWMRNDGEDNYFEQIIPVASIRDYKIPENSTQKTSAANNKVDVQFFPEGGKLVADVKSKIAFKSISPSGLGVDVNGVIVDNENNIVSTFVSAHLGMGYFYLTPQQGKTYKARLTYTNGTQNIINLPVIENKGLAFSIDNDSIPKATVRLQANKLYFDENKNKEYRLLIWSGGVLTSIACKLDKPVVDIDILKRRLHTGIATVTLFSPEGEPLCERLIFVQNYDRLNISINSNKLVYSNRDKVSISLNVKNRADEPSEGHFSVSVIDAGKVPVDDNAENSIFAQLLLKSDLKGFIEQPNYYFNHINQETTGNLDLVMLTHGYRRFQWKPLLDNSYPALAYQPEKGLEISGIAKSIWGKPLVNATVSLLPRHGGDILSQITGNDGSFTFSNLIFTDSTQFILQAINAKAGNNTVLTYNQYKNPPVLTRPTLNNNGDINQLMAIYLDNSKKQQENTLKYIGRRPIALKEVKIRSVKRNDNYRSSNYGGAGHADQVIHREELEKLGPDLGSVLSQKFHGLAKKAGMFIIDGLEVDNFSSVNINDVETVEALYGANATIYGMRVKNGNAVWVITTRQGEGKKAKDIPSKGILPITVDGFYKAREFYAPKYESKIINQPDLRSTIYWNPELLTDKDGNSTFSFYNSDGTGTYRLLIEGIDNKGNIGRQIYNYTVN